MPAQLPRGRRPGLPGCPRWMPPTVFTTVAVLAVYLLQQGYPVESITLAIITATTVACEVIRRLGWLSGGSQPGELI